MQSLSRAKLDVLEVLKESSADAAREREIEHLICQSIHPSIFLSRFIETWTEREGRLDIILES